MFGFPQQVPCYIRAWLCYTRRRLLLALWDATTAVGKSFRARRVLGNGPRVNGVDLADHSDQHILFCRQNLVAARRRFCRNGIHRPTIHSDLHHHGDCVPRGAARAGLHRVEVPGDSVFTAGFVFPRQHHAGSHVDVADHGVVHRTEPDGQQRVGEPALRSTGGGCGAGGSDGDAICVVLPLSRAGWEVWADEPEADGSVGGRRGGGGA